MKENAKENELVKKLTNKHYTITTANHVPAVYYRQQLLTFPVRRMLSTVLM